MHVFYLDDLVCEGCSGAIAETIHHLDPKARVLIDMAQSRVDIDSQLTREELALRLQEAGYMPDDE